MKDVSELYKRMEVYRQRLFALQCAPLDVDGELRKQIDWYQHEIYEMEAELAVEDLKYELDLNMNKPNVVVTDCQDTVLMLVQEERVVKLDHEWSWRHFKFMFRVEFYYKKRF